MSNENDELPQALPLKKKRGRPKKDKTEQSTKQFAIVLSRMSNDQRNALNAAAFAATQPSSEIVLPHSLLKGYKPQEEMSRVLPQTEPKSDHLFIKGMSLRKNVYTGRWEIAQVETNHGSFELGSKENDRVDQEVMTKVVLYLKSIFESDLESFLEGGN